MDSVLPTLSEVILPTNNFAVTGNKSPCRLEEKKLVRCLSVQSSGNSVHWKLLCVEII
jgi:hypothetical protein